MDELRRQRESILSVAAKWLPWCLGLVFALTIAWAVFVARVEIQDTAGRGSEEIAVSVAIKVATTLPLIFLCSLFITTALDLSGGAIMVTARYLTEKFLEPWREKRMAEIKAQGVAQGVEEGMAQKQREWEIWLHDKEEAAERVEPFDEPPPSL